jgi:hypothetical protein
MVMAFNQGFGLVLYMIFWNPERLRPMCFWVGVQFFGDHETENYRDESLRKAAVTQP